MKKTKIDSIEAALIHTALLEDTPSDVKHSSVCTSVMTTLRRERIDAENENDVWGASFASPLAACFSLTMAVVITALYYLSTPAYSSSVAELLADSNDTYISTILEEY